MRWRLLVAARHRLERRGPTARWNPRVPRALRHSGIALSKSTDGGFTWSTPVQVNKNPDVQAFTAAVEVASDGTVGVTYYDFRNNTSDPATLPTDYFIVHSHDGGATFGDEAHLVVARYACRCGRIHTQEGALHVSKLPTGWHETNDLAGQAEPECPRCHKKTVARKIKESEDLIAERSGLG
jgi:hypothetical protein